MEFSIALLNVFYAAFGAVTTLVFMVVGYWILDRIIPFRTGELVKEGNIAAGIVAGSVFISLGLAMGLVIGMGLN